MNQPAALLASLAASLPQAQAALEQAALPRLALHAASPAARALLGPPAVPRLASAEIALDVLAMRTRTAEAGLVLEPLGLGAALLHRISRREASSLRLEIVATPAARHAPAGT